MQEVLFCGAGNGRTMRQWLALVEVDRHFFSQLKLFAKWCVAGTGSIGMELLQISSSS